MLMYSAVGVECVQKRTVRFVTGNYNYETGSVTDILGQLKWKSTKNRGETIVPYYRTKGSKVRLGQFTNNIVS